MEEKERAAANYKYLNRVVISKVSELKSYLTTVGSVGSVPHFLDVVSSKSQGALHRLTTPTAPLRR